MTTTINRVREDNERRVKHGETVVLYASGSTDIPDATDTVADILHWMWEKHGKDAACDLVKRALRHVDTERWEATL